MNIVKKIKDQNGFAHILILPIVVVLVIGVVGAVVYRSQSSHSKTETNKTATGTSKDETNQSTESTVSPVSGTQTKPNTTTKPTPTTSSPQSSQSSPTDTPVSFGVISSGNADPAGTYPGFPYNPNANDYPYEYKLASDKLTVRLGLRNTGGYSITVKSVRLQESTTGSTYVVTTQETKPGPGCPLTSNPTYPYQTVTLGAGSNSAVSSVTLKADEPTTRTC